MGYKFQFITLAGFHALNYSMFKLAQGYRENGMVAYAKLQQAEFDLEKDGYTATRHQREVGTGYFDEVAQAISGGMSSTTALAGSTSMVQFERDSLTIARMRSSCWRALSPLPAISSPVLGLLLRGLS